MLYGVEQTISFVAWDTGNSTGKTGDSGNFTLRWIKDGTASAPTNSASEVDATNAPGIYKLTLTAAECQCLQGTLAGASSTADIEILPVQLAFVQVPNVAPGAENGLPIVDSNGDVSSDVTAIRAEIDSNSTQLAAILADTNELQTDDVPGLIAALNDLSAADILTTALTESYAADGAAPTLTQAVLLALQHLSESSISGTTKTVKQLDGSTTAATFTLDDASSPTSITRAT